MRDDNGGRSGRHGACVICSRDDLPEIEADMIDGRTDRELAAAYPGPSRMAYWRHRAHLSPALVRLADDIRTEQARDVLSRLESLYAQTAGIVLAAMREGKAGNGPQDRPDRTRWPGGGPDGTPGVATCP
jgi:hypothetical protein